MRQALFASPVFVDDHLLPTAEGGPQMLQEASALSQPLRIALALDRQLLLGIVPGPFGKARAFRPQGLAGFESLPAPPNRDQVHPGMPRAPGCHHGGTTKTSLDTDNAPEEQLVRVLLGTEPEDLGIMPISEAHALAAELDLELVEEDPNVEPPLVRICDYGKMTYEHTVRRREIVREARQIIREAGGEDKLPPPH